MAKQYTIRPTAVPLLPAGLTLASPWRRFCAVWINNLLSMAVAVAASFSFILFENDLEKNGYVLSGGLGIFVSFFACYLWLQIRFMRRYGQTVGKRVMKIRAVDAETGEKLSAGRYFWRRELLVFLLNYITSLPVLIDAVLVFIKSENRRSLEDIIVSYSRVFDLPFSDGLLSQCRLKLFYI